MNNAFLVIRTVFFALLLYFHVLVLVFALWNIVAATSSGMSAPGASVFLLTNSISTFVLVPAAYLGEIICAKARPAQVRVECVWTALMSILQLAASIDVTVDGSPMYCQMHSPWAVCTSSSLLVHTSWLVTLIIFAYCLTICVASATHATSLPDIWVTPVSRVPWFGPDAEASAPVDISRLLKHEHSKTPSCAVSKYIAERWEKLSRVECQCTSSGPALLKSGRQSVDPSRPPWARQHPIRRGVDVPFAKPLPECREPPACPVPPPRTQSRQAAISKNPYSVEVREQPQTRTCSPSTLVSRLSSVFPQKIANPDVPIPRPNLSEWVHANALCRINASVDRSSSL